jgi:hypothetical protein
VQQLLWIETLLNFFAGLLLVLAPASTIKLLGLPATASFWPRLLGTLFIGMAGAIFLEGSSPGTGGLGLAGLVVINAFAVSILGILLVLERGPATARGRAVMWAILVLLVWLSVLEIANLKAI